MTCFYFEKTTDQNSKMFGVSTFYFLKKWIHLFSKDTLNCILLTSKEC